MAQPLASTQRDQALALLKQRGIARRAELQSAGVTGTTVSRMERAGEIASISCLMPPSTRTSRSRKPPASSPKG